MRSARIGVYRLKPGVVDETIRRAEHGMLPQYRQLPGFVSYELIKTGPDSVISVSVWETHEEAEGAVAKTADWVRENLAGMVENVTNHVGDIAFRHLAARA